MKFFKQLYINPLFFYLVIGITVLFGISFGFLPLFAISKMLLLILFVVFCLDIILLFSKKTGITAQRITPEKLSNGDKNPIGIIIKNNYSFLIKTKLIDEIPIQFQIRNFEINRTIKSFQALEYTYTIKPNTRGEYRFGKLNIYTATALGLVSKRYSFDGDVLVKVYPSFMQLRKYDLLAFSNRLTDYGMKKIRRIGHTMEFEQIKEYVLGDDLRTINWNATAKKNNLMVNQFQDEKSQNVYMLIDKGRTMKMPFNEMSLLDYAVNASLVLSNVIIKKHDKAGMLAFSKTINNRVTADRKGLQMQYITENLYNIDNAYYESDYSKLYAEVKTNIKHRSLLILYTNFETLDGLNRQLPYLKAIAKNHLLVVVFFQNTELHQITKNKASTLQEIYDKTIAEKFIFEKKLIANELKKYGIHSVLTQPENLTIDTINKYLEIKARGIL